MNKIKLMYDIAKTMKDKEAFNGALQVECRKNEETVFQADNAFFQDLTTGLTSLKIRTEADYAGRRFKHESSTEFVHPGGGFCGRRSGAHASGCTHGFAGKRPHFHPMHSRGGHGYGGHGQGGLKGLFSGLTLALDLLNRTEVEEQADNTFLVTLKMTELPEELRKILSHKSHHGSFRQHGAHFRGESGGHGHEHSAYDHEHDDHDQFRGAPGQEHRRHYHHLLHRELQNLTEPALTVTARINANKEIELIDLHLAGNLPGDSGDKQPLELKAKVTFDLA